MTVDANWIEFIAGLGIFLYAMQRLETALRLLGEDTFRQLLLKATNSALGSAASGTVATAVLQSSSMVGLMVLAMVGSGILPLYNAIGMVVGANLGTTITGWLVTLLGFKLSLSEFALPMMGIGGLMYVLMSAHPRRHATGILIFALGLLLFGLDTMKSSVASLQEAFEPGQFAGYHSIVFLLVGVVFTAVIQSSSACMLITLNALSAGLIDLPMAAAIIIGADLGTTSTMLVGGLTGSYNKRRVAAAQVLFNLATAILAYALLLPFLNVILGWFSVTDPLYGLVAFHSFFNLLGVVMVLPLLKRIANLLSGWFAEQGPPVESALVDIPSDQVDVATYALVNVARDCCIQAFRINNRILKMPLESVSRSDSSNLSYEAEYEGLRDRIGRVSEYLLDVVPHANTGKKLQLNVLLKLLRHIGYATKAVKDIRQDLVASGLTTDRDVLRIKTQRALQEMERVTTIQAALMDSGKCPDFARLKNMQDKAEQTHLAFVETVHQLIQVDEIRGETFIILTNISKHLTDMIEQWTSILHLFSKLDQSVELKASNERT